LVIASPANDRPAPVFSRSSWPSAIVCRLVAYNLACVDPLQPCYPASIGVHLGLAVAADKLAISIGRLLARNGLSGAEWRRALAVVAAGA
jgi:hypothetical protein